jgi:Spy/CpxP family protein refolding chaperone
MINKMLILGTAMLLTCSTAALAQERDGQRGDDRRRDDRRGGEERGRFDPAQFQQRIMEGIKERLEITDEAEWKAVQPMVEKVMGAQRKVMGDRTRGLMSARRPGGPGGPGAPGGDRGPGGGFSSMFGQPNPAAEALQRAIDSKASKSELKAAVEKYQASRKEHQSELEAAQAELRKILTARQEAIATLSGLL